MMFVDIPKVKATTWTDITLPYQITESGNYKVTNNYDGSDYPLNITADNVIIDLQGHYVNVTNLAATRPFSNIVNSNILIENGEIVADLNGYSVFYVEGEEMSFLNVTIKSVAMNNGNALDIKNGGSVSVSDSRIEGGYDVVYVFGSEASATISNSNITALPLDNSYSDVYISNGGVVSISGSLLIGFLELYGSDSTVTAFNCTIINTGRNSVADIQRGSIANLTNCSLVGNDISTANGIMLSTSSLTIQHSLIFNCNLGIDFESGFLNCTDTFFNNTVNVFHGLGSLTNVYFNGSIVNSPRVYGNGPQGGNYWANPSHTGYSETGTDANHDGIIDAPYDIFGDQTIHDYLPYSNDYTPASTPLPSNNGHSSGWGISTPFQPTPFPSSSPIPVQSWNSGILAGAVLVAVAVLVALGMFLGRKR